VIKAKNRLEKRLRRTPEQARSDALKTARQLLLERGPTAITLQSVAASLGMSHTNLIHHFGSAAGLQAALMSEMIAELTSTLERVVKRFRAGQADARELVDLVFEAFDRGGAGRLAAWISLSGATDQLDTLGKIVRAYLRNVEAGAIASRNAHEHITSASLLVTLAAFGDAVIGESLGAMIGRERKAMRSIIASLLPIVLNEAAPVAKSAQPSRRSRSKPG
jgi:AcrR family transcriptional regulator